ncbi:MAG TPA: ATP-binding protein [Anaerolineae bacterium]|jgi:two-component system sensor histidine kinase DegS|nr:ATP-binding protein [Anaerolineae bacterium]
MTATEDNVRYEDDGPEEPTLTTAELTLPRFLEFTYLAYEKTLKELEEIDVLIKQSSAEVERLAQRNTRVANYVNQLQTNFDTIPREDIKEGYEALINAQQRLFTMRGQLEKLQSNQHNLRRLAEVQRRLLTVTEGLADLPDAPSRGRDQLNVIRVIQTEEAARQVLVRRMHDGPASSLSNFILQAEICERYFEVDSERAREELHELKSSATSTFRAVKDFIFDLRPMMLDDLGVVPTLRRYLESVEEKYGIEVSLTVAGVVHRLAGHVEVTLFRAVQELLNNARVHGSATVIDVQINMDGDQITIIVEDNGGGFNVDDALSEEGTRGTIGLPSLRDRIAMLDGQLAIESTLGRGTRAEFIIPVDSELSMLVS